MHQPSPIALCPAKYLQFVYFSASLPHAGARLLSASWTGAMSPELFSHHHCLLRGMASLLKFTSITSIKHAPFENYLSASHWLQQQGDLPDPAPVTALLSWDPGPSSHLCLCPSLAGSRPLSLLCQELDSFGVFALVLHPPPTVCQYLSPSSISPPQGGLA